MELTHLSLFSGIGGLDLAAEWAGFKTVGQCEFADYPTRVLEKHWPDVQRWRDIRTLTGESFYERTGRRTVDVISGGFPCQPFSVAGKQRGKKDDRYLWPEMVRVIKELRPTWVVGENVAGIINMALADILSELEAEGYRTRAFLIPACAVGANHRRYRVAILGYSDSNGSHDPEVGRVSTQDGGRKQKGEKATIKSEGAGRPEDYDDVADPKGKRERRLSVQPGKPRKENLNTERSREDVQYSNSPRCEEQYASEKPDQSGFSCWGCNEGAICDPTGKGLPDGTGEPVGRQRTSEQESKRSDCNVSDPTGRREQRKFGIWTEAWRPGGEDWWATEPNVGRVANGVPNRVDRIRCLGNAVVPQQFYPIFQAIAEIERREEDGMQMRETNR